MLCSDCCATYGSNGFDISDLTTAYADDVVVDEEEDKDKEDKEEEEEGVDENDDNRERERVEARKKGGRPTGSTLEYFRAQDLSRKQAVNQVCVQYAQHKKDRGGEQVEYGIRTKLVEQGRKQFGIEGDFDIQPHLVE